VKPYLHAVSASKKWGGKPEDYLPVEDFLDSSKAHHADMRHRALLHHSFGIFQAELFFGHNLTNADGVLVSVRDVAELHVIEDCGEIPNVSKYIEGMPFYDWLGGPARKKNTDAKGNAIPRVMNSNRLMDGASQYRSKADFLDKLLANTGWDRDKNVD
jgi:hypothetical protein